MQMSKLNEWLQIMASAGVIIGLLLVAYEVHQSNLYAQAEATRSNNTGWEEISLSEFETDIAEIFTKSITDSDSLTMAEIFRLSGYYTLIMNQYQRASSMADFGLSMDATEDLSYWSGHYFGTQFGKVWLDENKSWISPRHIAAIEQGLKLKSGEAKSHYLERIKSRL